MPSSQSVPRFFLLVFALSVPFWLGGALTGFQFLEGVPVSSLMTICPLLAAMILTVRGRGTEGVKALLKGAFDYRRIEAKVWYVPILLLVPGVMVLSYALLWTMRMPLPLFEIQVLEMIVLFLAFFLPALGEEVGWMGFAVDRMQRRWGAFGAGVVLGVIWAAWHVVPFVQAHRPPEWIAWQSLFMVATRVLIVWIYNNTGRSVAAAILFHDVSNVAVFSFPDHGSHYDPRIAGLITAVVAAFVTVMWGPRTLARHENA